MPACEESGSNPASSITSAEFLNRYRRTFGQLLAVDRGRTQAGRCRTGRIADGSEHSTDAERTWLRVAGIRSTAEWSRSSSFYGVGRTRSDPRRRLTDDMTEDSTILWSATHHGRGYPHRYGPAHHQDWRIRR